MDASLPSLYAKWLKEVIGGPIPEETKATCGDCVMLPAHENPPGTIFFNSVTKCCTFQPSVPNFLAGAVIAEKRQSSTDSLNALERRIGRMVAVTPRHVGSGAVFPLLYKNVANVFGRAASLRCEFLDASGGCGIWQHRPGVCATWYCKHVRGAAGERFWSLTGRLFRTIEQDLSVWCLAELNVGVAEVDEGGAPQIADVQELNGEVDAARYRRLWGEWAGRETEFYVACAELVRPLTWDEVCGICGPLVRILSGLVRDAYDQLRSDAIPERLRLRELRLTRVDGGNFRLVTYSNYDPLVISDALVRALRYFDGRPTDAALAAIRTEMGLRVDPKLLRRMLDFGVLEDGSETR